MEFTECGEGKSRPSLSVWWSYFFFSNLRWHQHPITVRSVTLKGPLNLMFPIIQSLPLCSWGTCLPLEGGWPSCVLQILQHYFHIPCSFLHIKHLFPKPRSTLIPSFPVTSQVLLSWNLFEIGYHYLGYLPFFSLTKIKSAWSRIQYLPFLHTGKSLSITVST